MAWERVIGRGSTDILHQPHKKGFYEFSIIFSFTTRKRCFEVSIRFLYRGVAKRLRHRILIPIFCRFKSCSPCHCLLLEVFILDEVKNRVIAERDELSLKFYNLTEFLSGDKVLKLPKEMQELLLEQHSVMIKYLWILNRRLDIWDNQ